MPKQAIYVFNEASRGKARNHLPPKMQEMYAKFNAWKREVQGKIVDMGGQAEGRGKNVTSEGATDGPFRGSKEVIGAS